MQTLCVSSPSTESPGLQTALTPGVKHQNWSVSGVVGGLAKYGLSGTEPVQVGCVEAGAAAAGAAPAALQVHASHIGSWKPELDVETGAPGPLQIRLLAVLVHQS